MAFDPYVGRKCREYIRDLIREDFPLDEIGIKRSEVDIRKFPWDLDKPFAGITIHPAQEAIGAGTNESDDIGYGVGVTYIRRTGAGNRDVDAIDTFRSYVMGHFLHKKIPVDTIYQCSVEPGKWQIPAEFRNHYDISALLVRCWSEKDRI